MFKSKISRHGGKAHKPYTVSIKSDVADRIATSSVDIRRGDIIVVGSDGLFDNVPLAQIASTVLQAKGRKPSTMAAMLARMAVNGRKKDDITALVGVVGR